MIFNSNILSSVSFMNMAKKLFFFVCLSSEQEEDEQFEMMMASKGQ